MKYYLITLFLVIWNNQVSAQSALEQAISLYQLGQYEKALSNAEIALEQHASPEALMVHADCLHKLGDYSRALDQYDKAKSSGYAQDDLLLHRGI